MSEVIKYNGFKIKVSLDDCSGSESPLKDDDFMFLISGAHEAQSINGGMNNPFKDAGFELEFNSHDDDVAILDRFVKQNPRYDYYLLYKYDHSGVAYSTSPFSCRFDSGQLGWLLVDREVRGWKKWSKKRREDALSDLNNCLDSYTKWSNGEAYHVKCKKVDFSCGGYYDESYAIADAKSEIDWYLNQKAA